MLQEDEDSLICDLAEYYHIYDDEKLPPSKVAVFAWGLPNESRIKRKLSNEPAALDTMLLAAMVDRLSFLVWAKTEDATKGKNRPASVLDALSKANNDTGTETEKKEGLTAYNSIDDWNKARQELLKNVKDRQNG